MVRRWVGTVGLGTLSLLAAPANATPPPQEAKPGSSVVLQAKKAAPPPSAKLVKKRLVLPPSVKARLTTPLAAKPLPHRPFTKSEVRKRTHARPTTQTRAGTKKVSYKKALAQMNADERRLNRYGYSLRGGQRKIKIREHAPNRRLLARQRKRAGQARLKLEAKRPPSRSDLRLKVRRESTSLRKYKLHLPNSTAPGYVVQRNAPATSNAAEFTWNPVYGDRWDAAAFLDVSGRFSGGFDNVEDGLRGTVEAIAGAYIMNDRYEAARFQAEARAKLDGTYSAVVTVSTVGGYEWPLYGVDQQEPFRKRVTKEVPTDTYEYTVTIPVAGIPVGVGIGVRPEIKLQYEVEATDRGIYASITPTAKLEARARVYVDGGVGKVGARGKLTLMEASPTVSGFAYPSSGDDGPEIRALVWGSLNAKMLYGSISAFLELGSCGWFDTFCLELEYEIFDFDGFEESFFAFESNRSLQLNPG